MKESKYNAIIELIKNAECDDKVKRVAIKAIEDYEKRETKTQLEALAREAVLKKQLSICDRNEELYEKHERGEISYEEIAIEYGVTINTAITWVERGSPEQRIRQRTRFTKPSWEIASDGSLICPICGSKKVGNFDWFCDNCGANIRRPKK